MVFNISGFIVYGENIEEKTAPFYSETQTEQKYDTLGKDADIYIAKNMKFCSL